MIMNRCSGYLSTRCLCGNISWVNTLTAALLGQVVGSVSPCEAYKASIFSTLIGAVHRVLQMADQTCKLCCSKSLRLL